MQAYLVFTHHLKPLKCTSVEIKTRIKTARTCKFPAHVWDKLKTGFPLCVFHPGAVNGDERFFVPFLTCFNLWMACLSCFLWNKSSDFDFSVALTGSLLLVIGNCKSEFLKSLPRRLLWSFWKCALASSAFASPIKLNRRRSWLKQLAGRREHVVSTSKTCPVSKSSFMHEVDFHQTFSS